MDTIDVYMLELMCIKLEVLLYIVTVLLYLL